MTSVCVTGASGFVGAALCCGLRDHGFYVRGAARELNSAATGPRIQYFAIGNIDGATDWSLALAGVDVLVHCAARAHVIKEVESNPLNAYRSVNVAGSRRLVEQAAVAGVRRMIFLSSIGVMGIHTNMRGPFSPSDVPAPVEDYAISKWEAEQSLREFCTGVGMELVVVRPPLVYGAGAGGNLARLYTLVGSGIPLPFGLVRNRRSLIGLDNLVDLLVRCIDHPKVVGKTLLVSDGQDLSTPDLLRMIANAVGLPARLFPVPVPLLRLAGRVLGRLNEVDRLVGSLQVDSSATREVLGWTPPVGVEEGIKRMVKGACKV